MRVVLVILCFSLSCAGFMGTMVTMVKYGPILFIAHAPEADLPGTPQRQLFAVVVIIVGLAVTVLGAVLGDRCLEKSFSGQRD